MKRRKNGEDPTIDLLLLLYYPPSPPSPKKGGLKVIHHIIILLCPESPFFTYTLHGVTHTLLATKHFCCLWENLWRIRHDVFGPFPCVHWREDQQQGERKKIFEEREKEIRIITPHYMYDHYYYYKEAFRSPNSHTQAAAYTRLEKKNVWGCCQMTPYCEVTAFQIGFKI